MSISTIRNEQGNLPSIYSKSYINTAIRLCIKIFLIIVGLVNVYAFSSYSQNKLNIEIYNGKITELIRQIHNQSDYVFLYKDADIKSTKKISISLKKSTIYQVLDHAFRDTKLDYKIVGRQILLSASKKIEPKTGSPKTTAILQQLVKGTVLDSNNEPLPGANVVIKGASKGTQTDFDGHFEIEIADGEVLEVSFVGFVTKTVNYQGQEQLDIQLQEDAAQLSEVIVTGYTSQNVKSLTGSVAVVSAENLAATTPTGIEQALQGQAAGVTVGLEGGPGGSATVRVRGFGTINGNDPLYVIDGIQTGQGLNDLNPNDIESITVLKDAAAASIYGIGAANGVIVITTKKGKQNEKVRFGYSGITGVDFIPKSVFPKMGSPLQIANARWQALKNDGASLSHPQYGNGDVPVLPDYILPAGVVGSVDETTYSFPDNRITRANKQGTDWFDEYFSGALVTQHNISIQSGSEKAKMYLGLGILDQDGVGRATSFDRYNLRTNSEFSITDKFRIGEALNVSYSKRIGLVDPIGTASNQNNEGQIAFLYRMNPLIPVTDIRGNYAGTSGIGGVGNASNPIGIADRNRNNPSEVIKALGSLYAELDLATGLSLKTTFTADLSNGQFSFFRPLDPENSAARQVNTLIETSNTQRNIAWFTVAQYNADFGNSHSLDAFAGVEYKKNHSEFFSAQVSDFLLETPDFTYLDSGRKSQLVKGRPEKSATFSLFGKVDYAYKDRYLMSATLRKDQSSKFEKGNQSAIFPAFSVGWRPSEETFMEQADWINNLLIKLSWGELGNNAIPASRGVSAYNSNLDFFNYNGQSGFYLTNIGDPNLTWETTTTTNLGITTSFLDNALDFNLDLYRSITRDMLLPVPADPTVFGTTIQSIYRNIGQMTNTGFDLGLSYNNENTDDQLQYTVGLNISHYSNTVDFLDPTNPDLVIFNPSISQSQTAFETTNTITGQPISSFVGYTWNGIDPNTGRAIITGSNRDVIGNPHPDFTYGIQCSAKYKQFDLSFLIQGSQGNDIYNLTKYWTDFSSFEGARSQRYIENSWTPNQTNALLPQLTLAATTPVNGDENNRVSESIGSSYYIEDGSYARLKNIAVGYSFGSQLIDKFGIDKFRIFLQGKNLLTWTNYSGLDPEVNVVAYDNPQETNLEIGVDRGAYPISRSINLGLQVSF